MAEREVIPTPTLTLEREEDKKPKTRKFQNLDEVLAAFRYSPCLTPKSHTRTNAINLNLNLRRRKIDFEDPNTPSSSQNRKTPSPSPSPSPSPVRVRVVSPYFSKPASRVEGEVIVVAQSNKKNKRITATDGGGNLDSKKQKRRNRNTPPPPVRVVSPYFPKPATRVEGEVIVVQPKGKKRRIRKTPVNSPVLSASQKLDEAYRRKEADNKWKPPPSPHSLLQESHFDDPWKVLIICMLLNITTADQAREVIPELFRLCPDAKTAITVSTKEIEKVIQRLGLYRKRAAAIQQISREYLEESWTHVTQLHGVGKYAADAYAIFCTGKWDRVNPTDHKLVDYWNYLWQIC